MIPGLTEAEAEVALRLCDNKEDEAGAQLASSEAFRRQCQVAAGMRPAEAERRPPARRAAAARPRHLAPKDANYAPPPENVDGAVFVGAFKGRLGPIQKGERVSKQRPRGTLAAGHIASESEPEEGPETGAGMGMGGVPASPAVANTTAHLDADPGGRRILRSASKGTAKLPAKAGSEAAAAAPAPAPAAAEDLTAKLAAVAEERPSEPATGGKRKRPAAAPKPAAAPVEASGEDEEPPGRRRLPRRAAALAAAPAIRTLVGLTSAADGDDDFAFALALQMEEEANAAREDEGPSGSGAGRARAPPTKRRAAKVAAAEEAEAAAQAARLTVSDGSTDKENQEGARGSPAPGPQAAETALTSPTRLAAPKAPAVAPEQPMPVETLLEPAAAAAEDEDDERTISEPGGPAALLPRAAAAREAPEVAPRAKKAPTPVQVKRPGARGDKAVEKRRQEDVQRKLLEECSDDDGSVFTAGSEEAEDSDGSGTELEDERPRSARRAAKKGGDDEGGAGAGAPKRRAAKGAGGGPSTTAMTRTKTGSGGLGRVKKGSVKVVDLHSIGVVRADDGWFNAGYIFTDGYKSSTNFRSSVELNQLVVHYCEIVGEGGEFWPLPTFKVTAMDRPEQPMVAKSCTGCWTAILKRINGEINRRRTQGEDLPVPPKTAIAGPEYFGLNQGFIVDQIEELDPEHLCTTYWAGKDRREALKDGRDPGPSSRGGRAKRPRDEGAGAGAGLEGAGAGLLASKRGRGGGGRRRRSDEDEEDADRSDDETAYISNRWNQVNRAERYRKRAGGEEGAVDDENPCPDLIDPITLEPVQNPAISPYGHVMGAGTWKAVLKEQGKCPFTQKTLRWEQITVLTHLNYERFKDKIIT